MAGVTKTADIAVTAREVDFVTRFGQSWEHLREIMGISRPIKKMPGTKLKSKKAVGTLESGTVTEGTSIPYSKFEVAEFDYADISIEKYAKAVSIEAIKDHGYEAAVQMTDDAFLTELQNKVTKKFYTYIATGDLKYTASTYQLGLSMAKALVANKFKKMHKTATGFVGFVSELDVAQYLGSANITVQNEYGFSYIKNFLGFNTIFVLSDAEVPQGKIFATAVDNIVMYYVDPADSDFAKAGLSYTVEGETNLVGFHTQGNYNTAVSEEFAIMGITLFAEYIDAISVVTVSGITPITFSGYTYSDLMEMTKAEISALATQKGYTITATDKQGMIEQFLAAQAG